MKLFAFIIEAVYWVGLFIVPSIVLCFIAFWLYSNDRTGLFVSVLLGVTGIIVGITLAEYIRKKFGLSNFWSGVSTNLDNIPDEEKTKK